MWLTMYLYAEHCRTIYDSYNNPFPLVSIEDIQTIHHELEDKRKDLGAKSSWWMG